jgi:hypothetical protein
LLTFSDEFALFLDYTKELEYADEPDYSYLKSLFTECLSKNNWTLDYKYDWSSDVVYLSYSVSLFRPPQPTGAKTSHPKRRRVLKENQRILLATSQLIPSQVKDNEAPSLGRRDPTRSLFSVTQMRIPVSNQSVEEKKVLYLAQNEESWRQEKEQRRKRLRKPKSRQFWWWFGVLEKTLQKKKLV